ncbi:hypothetical protein PRIPAC_70038 [Pristionchus pacificus]|uniref:Uncharacterized protein n=1 Tax=Pristionchus pacificus TaxID=54126 RepID=A0A2A6C5Y5_PRIPA|nr:hypothetical protein PRIPAC_70038 [Pristionchus pacificus]|eukprot:PDM73622.1 hypothetical protein PRIPAC_40978 [Pristionchus pacificus]
MISSLTHLLLIINLSISMSEEVAITYRIESIHRTFLRNHFQSNASDGAKVTSGRGDCEHWYIREQWRTVELMPECSPHLSLRASKNGSVDLDNEQNLWAPFRNNDGSWSFEHISEYGGWLSADENGTVQAQRGARDSTTHFWIDEWTGPEESSKVEQTFCLQEDRHLTAKYIGISMPNWRVGLSDQCGPCGQFIIEYHQDQIALKEFCSGKYFAPIELSTPELQRRHRDKGWPPFYVYVAFTEYTEGALLKPYKTGGLSFKSKGGWILRTDGHLTTDQVESYKAMYSLTPYTGRGSTHAHSEDFTVIYCVLGFLILFGAPFSCLINCYYKRKMLHRLLNCPLPADPFSVETTKTMIDCEINHHYQSYSPYSEESGLLTHKEEVEAEEENVYEIGASNLPTNVVGEHCIKTWYNVYLRAWANQSDWHVGTAPVCERCEQWTIEKHGEKVALREYCSGKYLRANVEMYVDLAEFPPKDHELWTPIKNADPPINGTWSFRSHHGTFLRAQPHGRVSLQNNHLGDESFWLEPWAGIISSLHRCSFVHTCSKLRRLILSTPLPPFPGREDNGNPINNTATTNGYEYIHDYEGVYSCAPSEISMTDLSINTETTYASPTTSQQITESVM